MVLAAHNDVYGGIFRYLREVPLGEIVTGYAGEQVTLLPHHRAAHHPAQPGGGHAAHYRTDADPSLSLPLSD